MFSVTRNGTEITGRIGDAAPDVFQRAKDGRNAINNLAGKEKVLRRPDVQKSIDRFNKGEIGPDEIVTVERLDDGGAIYTKGGVSQRYDADGFIVVDSKVDLFLSPNAIGRGKSPTDFNEANAMLLRQIDGNSDLARQIGLTADNVAELGVASRGTAPTGWTWHHQDIGRLQLVRVSPHNSFAHTGGASIWGGF